jgi:hypothetical protein
MARTTKNKELTEPQEIGDLADTHSEYILTEDPRYWKLQSSYFTRLPKRDKGGLTETKGRTYAQSVGSMTLERS